MKTTELTLIFAVLDQELICYNALIVLAPTGGERVSLKSMDNDIATILLETKVLGESLQRVYDILIVKIYKNTNTSKAVC